MNTPARHPTARITRRSQADVVAALRECVHGDILLPDDHGYDAARRGFNLLADPRPAIVVMAQGPFDVVDAVRFARQEDLRVAVMATGHGPGPAADGALLINTSRMTEVTVDPVQRTARIAAGARWSAVLSAAQQHGLAPLLGSSSGVGAVGYTLGGGFGWLGRKYGLSCDSVRQFELVTPDGEPIVVDETRNPEIFWALHGGGAGSLGVVTAMQIDLMPVATVYAGNLFYPASEAADVLRRFRQWAPNQADDLTSAVTLINFPPLDEIPEMLRGKSFVLFRGCWTGDLDEGRRVIDEWRSWREPQLDLWSEIPFAAIDAVSMDPTDPMPGVVSCEWFDDVSDDAVEILTQRLFPADGVPLLLLAEIRHAGGAIARNATAAAADAGRSGNFLLELIGVVPDPHVGLAVESAIRLTRTALAPHVTGAAYLNFVEGDELSVRGKSAFSDANHRRIVEVKQALDPQNRFCHGVDLRA